MERYMPTADTEVLLQNVFQTGGDMDGYIYSQEGEGIGSFFGNLFKKVIPLATKAIKGAAAFSKPHLQKAVSDLAAHAGERLIKEIEYRKPRTSVKRPRRD